VSSADGASERSMHFALSLDVGGGVRGEDIGDFDF
jgi:hypothetical protein